MSRPSSFPKMSNYVQELASRQDGMSISDIYETYGVPRSTAQVAFIRLLKDEKIVKVSRSAYTRYFLTQKAADDWVKKFNEICKENKHIREIAKRKRRISNREYKVDEIYAEFQPLVCRKEGASVAELLVLTGISRTWLNARLKACVDSGKIFKMPYGSKTAYFESQADADARKRELIAKAVVLHRERVAESRSRLSTRGLSASKVKRDAINAKVQKFSEMPVVIPEDVKITKVEWTPDYRYFVDPSKIKGEFTEEWNSLRGQSR